VVVVPVTLRFEPLAEPPSFFEGVPPPSDPPPEDFAVTYTYGCKSSSRTVVLGSVGDAAAPAFSAADVTTVHREMGRVGFFQYPTQVTRPAPPPPRVRFDTTGDGITVLVRDREHSGGIRVSGFPVWHTFEVRRVGTSVRVAWEDVSGPSLSREVEGVRSVIATVHAIIARADGAGWNDSIHRTCYGI
jgi:hypothetical protein